MMILDKHCSTSILAKTIRKHSLRMMYKAGSSHIGACLSMAEILAVLYDKILKVDPARPTWPERDRFILSKGHGAAIVYALLAERGFFPKEYLERYCVDGGILPGHVDMKAVPGIETSAGSLGHGLSIGVGMAIANRNTKNPGRIFVLLGDGECNAGSVWEAVMLAAHLKLTNITAIVDFNKLQGFGRTDEVINQENLAERWQAFNWETYQTDGHDLDKLEKIFNLPQSGPKAIIAHTVKGKGISFMEDKLEWHYKSPNKEQYQQAVKELAESL